MIEGCVIYAVLYHLFAVLGAWLLPYTVNSWLHVAGKTAHMGHWPGFFICLIPGLQQLVVVAAVATYICMFFF